MSADATLFPWSAPIPQTGSTQAVPGDTLITARELRERVAELGAEITRDYAGRDLVLVGVLKGVFVFMADLMRAIRLPLSVDFLAISQYRPGDRGVRLVKDLDRPIAGRHVLLVEDIIDTGLTAAYLVRTLQARRPASLKMCILLDRPRRRLIDIPVAYRGFEIPDAFVVGYGMDYKQQFRNLPYVALLRGVNGHNG
jgi:hypoxanthine phosphoribosyltransferase